MIREDKPSGKVICHSQAPNGEELITVEIELHRFILPENNTHRVFSRNYQSSRACPVTKQLEQIANDPAMPVYYGKNKSGMQAEEELTGMERKLAEMIILSMRDACLNGVKQLQELGLHKQTANRYIEPWLWTKGVVTATREGWNSFFKLRCHKDAQPEIKLLAERIEKAVSESIPEQLQYGQYHLPYVPKYDKEGNPSYYDDATGAIKISTSCTAQVSYRVLDDSLEKALGIYDMLNLPVDGVYPDEPPHYSPTEHVAKVVESTLIEHSTDGTTTHYYPDQSGNFNSLVFWQYRKALEAGLESDFVK